LVDDKELEYSCSNGRGTNSLMDDEEAKGENNNLDEISLPNCELATTPCKVPLLSVHKQSSTKLLATNLSVKGKRNKVKHNPDFNLTEMLQVAFEKEFKEWKLITGLGRS
jgi:hypothetical protein